MNTLAQVAIGQRVRVSRIEGKDDLAARLMEMGLVPGIDVTVVGSAPLGDPLEIEVQGYRLSVRKSEAALVKIEAG